MKKAARAIIFEGDKILVMHRNKQGTQYFTLVGGQVKDSETEEEALVREVQEETGLEITGASLVFIEKHPEPYNQQYTFLCSVGPHKDVAIQVAAEESFMNQIGINVHTPVWVPLSAFATLSFLSPQLQTAIMAGLKNGFPKQPMTI
jgi:8-oxo-dGTP diphosphatase